MTDINLSSIRVQPVQFHLDQPEPAIDVLRLDTIHPVISGNKWFKLRYYLQEAIDQEKQGIVTWGGPWSNHIVATAAACRVNHLNSYGIIRGEKPPQLSPTLGDAMDLGMKLIFCSREQYRNKFIPAALDNEENYFINEGGFGTAGAAGAATILDYIDKASYTHICCACGTGTMIAGIINASLPEQRITGISVLKNNHSIHEQVAGLLTRDHNNYFIDQRFHFNGYAKFNEYLLSFMNDLFQTNNIPTDLVYTSKLFYGARELVREKYFRENEKILLIHSGGLQGNRSLRKGTLIF